MAFHSSDHEGNIQKHLASWPTTDELASSVKWHTKEAAAAHKEVAKLSDQKAALQHQLAIARLEEEEAVAATGQARHNLLMLERAIEKAINNRRHHTVASNKAQADIDNPLTPPDFIKKLRGEVEQQRITATIAEDQRSRREALDADVARMKGVHYNVINEGMEQF